MKIYTVSEIAKIIGYTTARVYQLLKEMNVPIERHGSTYVISEKIFNKFFKNKIKLK